MSVAVGNAFEYRVSKIGWTGSANYTGDGYIYAGIQVPLVDSRGTVILVVDNTFTNSLVMELTRLEDDLTGDGWVVIRHDVPRMAVDPADTSSSVWAARASELANVKSLIKADYNANPSSVTSVFIFGHVPVLTLGIWCPTATPTMWVPGRQMLITATCPALGRIQWRIPPPTLPIRATPVT